MDDQFATLSNEDLVTATGGGWKSKVAKGAWEFAKWTGIPSAVGAGAAWLQHQFGGANPAPQQPPADPPQ